MSVASLAAPAERDSAAQPQRQTRALSDRTRRIIVTDSGRGSALAMIRSLSRRGWHVVAADSVRRNLRFASRHAAETLYYPSPQTDSDAYITTMLAAAQDGADLIIPITDEALLPLSRHRNRFPESCQLAIPDASMLELTTNKQKTLELAKQLGVPVPRTAVVTTATQAVDCSAEFQWPIVLKPLVSRLCRDGQPIEALTVSYAEDVQALRSRMQKLEQLCPVLLQEYIPGIGKGVELLAYEGRVLAAFQHQRLREVPVTGGASSLRQSVPLDREMLDYASRLMKALNWTGLAMVEFKAGASGPRLMEINGRVWGSLPLAFHSGMDFPARLADLYLNGPPETDVPFADQYRTGVIGRNLELDVVWMLSVLAGRQRYACFPLPSRIKAIQAMLGLLNPRIRFDIQSLVDPFPGVAELLRIVEKVIRKGGRAP